MRTRRNVVANCNDNEFSDQNLIWGDIQFYIEAHTQSQVRRNKMHHDWCKNGSSLQASSLIIIDFLVTKAEKYCESVIDMLSASIQTSIQTCIVHWNRIEKRQTK